MADAAGGIDDGEAPLDAAYRELREETGVGPGHVQLLGQTADWYRYDFPSELAVGRWKNRFRGQAQIWAHFRLTAPDSVIDLDYDDVEFSDWRWMTATDVVAAIIPFKRDIYRGVLSEFGLLSDA